MQFFRIQDPYALFREVLRCEGIIYYTDTDGYERDFKPLARQFLSTEHIFGIFEIPKLEIYAESAQDRKKLMRHIFDAHYPSAKNT